MTASSALVAVSASKIAVKVAPRVGFDPLTIIMTLIPILTQCFQKTEPAADPKEYLLDHFDVHTGTFDRRIIDRVRPQTRRAVRKSGQTRVLNRDALDIISTETLMRVLNEDSSDVASVMSEVDPRNTAATDDAADAGE